ncbi:MAG: MBL fold metallo-hydrolase [Candidatus Cloacimonetes bacterium]|nr:MBL fold metallo-hydrolase [Candidatus Cloacimonadota bacterium]
MGVLPKAIWEKFLETDEKNRIKLALNLLLIRTEGKNILIDTGIGNKISDKIKKIFNPSEFVLLQNLSKLSIAREDINFVVLTHLHFDHAGGVTSLIDGRKELTFPNAIHIIQKREWETAKKPDELNKASYNFEEDLKLLEETGNYRLVDGNHRLTDEITLELTGGHSEGMQIVRIESNGELGYFPGDIIPQEAHRHLSVTSAYDICRKDTFRAKKKILQEVEKYKGIIFLNHDNKKNILISK